MAEIIESENATTQINSNSRGRRSRRGRRRNRNSNNPNDSNLKNQIDALNVEEIKVEENDNRAPKKSKVGNDQTRKRAERRRRAKMRTLESLKLEKGDDVIGITSKLGQLSVNESRGKESKQRKREKKRSTMTDEEKRKNRKKMRDAAYAVVDTYFKGMTHLQILHEMCFKILGIQADELPSSIEHCQDALAEIHVNIYDYVDGMFPSRNELIYYNIDDLRDRCEKLKYHGESESSGNGVGYYSIKSAKQEGLKDLLRSFFHGRRRDARRH